MHLFCPPPWGKQDKEMRTDGLREEAAPSLLCVSGLVSQSFPLCWRKDCWQVCLLPNAPPSCLAMVSLLFFPSMFSISPCLHSAGPAVLLEALSFIPQPLVVWACGRGSLKKQRKPSKHIFLLPPSPRRARAGCVFEVLRLCLCLFLLLSCLSENLSLLLARLGHCQQAPGYNPPHPPPPFLVLPFPHMEFL